VQTNAMRQSVKKFVERVVERLAWYLFFEQFDNIHMELPVTDKITIQDTLTPEEREGDFLDHNFEIDLFSLYDQSPSEKASSYLAVWNGYVMPNAEIARQSGWVPAFEEGGRALAKWNNIPFEMLFTHLDPEYQEPQVPGQVPMPARFRQSEQIRRSVTGQSANGNLNAVMDANAHMSPPKPGGFQKVMS